MKNFLPLLLIFFLTPALGQTDDQKLRELLDTFLQKVDSKEMHDRFWAEDLIYTSSSGSRHGKAQIMEGFDKAGEEVPERLKPSYSSEEVQVKIFKDVAVVAFKLVSITSDGTISNYWNSGTFKKRKGIWKVVNWQATKIPE